MHQIVDLDGDIEHKKTMKKIMMGNSYIKSSIPPDVGHELLTFSLGPPPISDKRLMQHLIHCHRCLQEQVNLSVMKVLRIHVLMPVPSQSWTQFFDFEPLALQPWVVTSITLRVDEHAQTNVLEALTSVC